MTKFTEVIQGISHALHITKPLLFELVLFIWAGIEMFKFIYAIAFGEAS